MGPFAARRRGWALLAAVCAAGCVDGFRGSNVQIDLSPAVPAQASAGATPQPTQLPANAHYTLVAIDDSANAKFTARLGGLLAGSLGMPTAGVAAVLLTLTAGDYLMQLLLVGVPMLVGGARDIALRPRSADA